MTSTALNAALENFTIKDNEICINNTPITRIIAQTGTPCYLYDKSVVESKIELLRKYLPKEFSLYYAVKANPNPELLSFINPLVDGFDIASSGELEAVINAGADPLGLSFAGPGKTYEDLSNALARGIGSINIESESELLKLVELGEQKGITPNVSIRINPNFELHGSGMKMGGGAKQFGIDVELVPDVLKKLDRLTVNFQGFHIYAGSQNLDAVAISLTFEKIFHTVEELSGSIDRDIPMINFGGGFGIPYFAKDQPLDIKKISHALHDMMPFLKKAFSNTKFVIELGRYITGECGIYITQVVTKKQSRGKTFLVTDGGMNHHLAASGNLGQILKKNYPIVNPAKIKSDKTQTCQITGPLCTPLDSLGTNVILPGTNEGEYIAIMNSGAYGYTASPLTFLSHAPPKEIVI